MSARLSLQLCSVRWLINGHVMLCYVRLTSTLMNFFCRTTGRAGWNTTEAVTAENALTQPSFSGQVKSSPSASRPISRHMTGIAVGFFIVNDCVSFLHVTCQLTLASFCDTVPDFQRIVTMFQYFNNKYCLVALNTCHTGSLDHCNCQFPCWPSLQSSLPWYVKLLLDNWMWCLGPIGILSISLVPENLGVFDLDAQCCI